MSIGLVIIFLIAIFGFIVMAKAKEIARTNEEWMRAAGKLKIAFKKAGGILDSPRLGGEVDGVPVSVSVAMEKRGDRVIPFTVYAVQLPEGSSVESVLDKASSRMEAVRTGHPLIDKLLSAGGFDRAKVREMMNEVKEAAVEKFAKAFPNVSVSESRVVCKFEGMDADADMINARITQLVRLAKDLGWQAGGEAAHGFQERAFQPPPALSLVPVEAEEAAVAQPERAKTLERSARKPDAAPAPARQAQDSKPATQSEPVHAAQKPAASTVPVQPPAFRQAPKPMEAAPAAQVPKPAPQTPGAMDFFADPEPLAKALFANPLPGQAEKNLFNSLKGSRVEWRGVLKSAQEYGMDFNFSGGAGSKAILDVCEVSGSGGSLKVRIKAVVQLPKGASQALKAKTGQSVGFKGELFKFEPFAKELYVSGGELAD